MNMKRTVFIVVVLAVFGGGLYLQAQGRTRSGASGRFAILTPPSASDGLLNNFLWKVDTETGSVSAYRIVQFKDTDGKTLAWAVDELPDAEAVRKSTK